MSLRDRVRRPSHGTVVGYMALVVALSGSAYAATGGTFTLGEKNKANNVTSLRNTADGSALKLSTNDGNQPNLKVSNDAKIKKLNADKLDGKSQGAFFRKANRPINAVVVDGTADEYTNTSPAAVSNMSVQFTIPNGPDREVTALFTAECAAAGDRGDWANVVIRLDGNIISPGGTDAAFCSPQATGSTTDDGWIGAAVQGVAEDIDPGQHTVDVRVDNNGTTAVRLDDMALTVLALP